MSTHNRISGIKTIQIYDEHINHEEYETLKKEENSSEKDKDRELDQYYFIRHKKRKMSNLVQEGFKRYTKMIDKLIKSGVMYRLFAEFDFFSEQDRDPLSPRS